MTVRALARRCPNCGGKPLFRTWFRTVGTCPRCGLDLERGESGYAVGAYMFNIIAAEMAFAAIFLAVLFAKWPDPPWELLMYGGAVLMVLLPLLFYPFSKTLFLAFDLLFRPAGHEPGKLIASPPAGPAEDASAAGAHDRDG